MGRYQGDVYYSGGAYYFSTLAAAEFFFSLAGAVARRIRTNSLSPDDLSSIKALVGAEQALDAPGAFDALLKRGDSFMATVRAYTPASGDLSEQFDGATGQFITLGACRQQVSHVAGASTGQSQQPGAMLEDLVGFGCGLDDDMG